MKSVFLGLFTAVIALFAYLLLWPVPVAPASWDAPEDLGFTGIFTPNTDLADLSMIDLTPHHGAEDVVAMSDGRLLASTQDGYILLIDPAQETVDMLAETGGVPLGLEIDTTTGRLLVADAYRGLLSVGIDGSVEVLTDRVEGSPILYADDLDIADDGVIYFSDASTKFGAAASASTLDASLLEILEGVGTGRLLAYDPTSQETRIVAAGHVFANGVAMAPDGDVLMLETGRYRLLKIDPDTGDQSVLIDNLPGFPDNINHGPIVDGVGPTYFIGLASPRAAFLDGNSDKPWLRALAMRMPKAFQPKPQAYGVVFQIGADGTILRTWQDPNGAYPTTTGAVFVRSETLGDRIYITALQPTTLGYRPYP
ncbi:SMP-30/gluconolactonase/LRE family protein [Algimonas porphyrae]|nr:SMP-30/gluconolactonase/LRE family protein [Algimonas porphyrae]